MKKIVIAGGVVIVILAALLLLPQPTQAPVETIDPLDMTKWETFTSEEFKFSIEHPSAWQVAEFYNDPIAPRVNIYKKGEVKQPPFDHHSMVTQVSFFPQGVPTEGVFGDIVTSTVAFNEPYERPYDFILSDKTPWATILTATGAPEPWQPGFIWIENEIQGLQEKCFKASTEVPMERCDMFTGDRVIRYGSIDAIDRKVEEEMLKTFEFTK